MAYQAPKLSKIDPYSLVACPLEPLANRQRLSWASGFLWTHGEHHFLVTNWHVLSGINPDTGASLAGAPASPNELRFTAWRTGSATGLETSVVTLTLINDDGQCTWLEHPKYGRAVDIAAVFVGSDKFAANLQTLNQLPDTQDMAVHVGSDVFIVGWPFPPDVVGPTPVWKRGTIATEPATAKSIGKREILVDTATKQGMSGSLVIARSVGLYQTESGDQIGDPGPHSRFIGVYSGRFGDLGEAQLGRVWDAALIDDVISGAKPGDIPRSR